MEDILNPNCSEAVFRFYTLDPKKIRFILQAIADEISANTEVEEFKNQKIPLFKTAEEYDTNWSGETSYSTKHLEAFRKAENQEEWAKLREEISKREYPNVLLRSVAGLGDNEAIITIEKDKGAFRLNIGNNDISNNTTGWIEKIKSLGIKVEEAETCPELQKYARDCTCGIVFFE